MAYHTSKQIKTVNTDETDRTNGERFVDNDDDDTLSDRTSSSLTSSLVSDDDSRGTVLTSQGNRRYRKRRMNHDYDMYEAESVDDDESSFSSSSASEEYDNHPDVHENYDSSRRNNKIILQDVHRSKTSRRKEELKHRVEQQHRTVSPMTKRLQQHERNLFSDAGSSADDVFGEEEENMSHDNIVEAATAVRYVTSAMAPQRQPISAQVSSKSKSTRSEVSQNQPASSTDDVRRSRSGADKSHQRRKHAPLHSDDRRSTTIRKKTTTKAKSPFTTGPTIPHITGIVPATNAKSDIVDDGTISGPQPTHFSATDSADADAIIATIVNQKLKEMQQQGDDEAQNKPKNDIIAENVLANIDHNGSDTIERFDDDTNDSLGVSSFVEASRHRKSSTSRGDHHHRRRRKQLESEDAKNIRADGADDDDIPFEGSASSYRYWRAVARQEYDQFTFSVHSFFTDHARQTGLGSWSAHFAVCALCGWQLGIAAWLWWQTKQYALARQAFVMAMYFLIHGFIPTVLTCGHGAKIYITELMSKCSEEDRQNTDERTPYVCLTNVNRVLTEVKRSAARNMPPPRVK